MKYFVMCAAAMFLANCSDSKETAATTADGKDLATKQSNSGDTAEPAAVASGASASAGTLPGGFTVYPGSSQSMNLTEEENGKPSGITVLETSDKPEKVIAFYRAEAAKLGMTNILPTFSMGIGEGNSTSSIVAENPTTEAGIVITAVESGGKTKITVIAD